MAKVLFKCWNNGLKKISLTKLLQEKANLSLKEAKSKTDFLLDGETFIIETESVEEAVEIAKQATAMGAVCKIIKDIKDND